MKIYYIGKILEKFNTWRHEAKVKIIKKKQVVVLHFYMKALHRLPIILGYTMHVNPRASKKQDI